MAQLANLFCEFILTIVAAKMFSEVSYHTQVFACGNLRIVATLEFLQHHFSVNGSQESLFSMTHTMSAIPNLWVHPTYRRR
jgi:hypothetical protein